MQVFENKTIIVLSVNCKNLNSCVCVLAYVFCVCAQARVIAIYWPGINNTALLAVHRYVFTARSSACKYFQKHKGITFLFLAQSWLCKHTLKSILGSRLCWQCGKRLCFSTECISRLLKTFPRFHRQGLHRVLTTRDAMQRRDKRYLFHVNLSFCPN